MGWCFTIFSFPISEKHISTQKPEKNHFDVYGESYTGAFTTLMIIVMFLHFVQHNKQYNNYKPYIRLTDYKYDTLVKIEEKSS